MAITYNEDGSKKVRKGDKKAIAEGKNLMVPDSLQDKYKRKKQIEDYHKNKLKLRKKGIV